MSYRRPGTVCKESSPKTTTSCDANRSSRAGGLELVIAASAALRLQKLQREVDQTKERIGRLHEYMQTAVIISHPPGAVVEFSLNFNDGTPTIPLPCRGYLSKLRWEGGTLIYKTADEVRIYESVVITSEFYNRGDRSEALRPDTTDSGATEVMRSHGVKSIEITTSEGHKMQQFNDSTLVSALCEWVKQGHGGYATNFKWEASRA